jgi:hypothetical protein
MSSGFLGCWVNDCSGYHIGYIAGIVCLFFGIVLYLTSHYFETSLDLDKTSLDFKNESYKEIKMCFSSLGIFNFTGLLRCSDGSRIFIFKGFIHHSPDAIHNVH